MTGLYYQCFLVIDLLLPTSCFVMLYDLFSKTMLGVHFTFGGHCSCLSSTWSILLGENPLLIIYGVRGCFPCRTNCYMTRGACRIQLQCKSEGDIVIHGDFFIFRWSEDETLVLD